MAATRFVSVMLAMLLAVTMVPAGAISPAFADEPAADGEVVENGLRYRVADGAATLVGFEDGAALEGVLVVPEIVGDGATVKAVEVAEGQVADKVTALALPQTVESVRTEGLASAFPALTSIEIAAAAEGDGSDTVANGVYSSVAGMLFRSAEGQASSDGTAFADDALELVWAPSAMVVARIPLECKAIASGAFVDAAALETVMSFGKMESIAAAEKDDEGNVTKPGAFTDEQIGRLTIVVPGTNYAVTGENAERVSGSVALSEKTDMLEKRKTWFHYGFDTEQIIMGAPFGEIEGVIGVDDEGIAEDRSLITPLQNGKGHLELTPEEQAEVDARKAAEPKDGLSFSYQASMDLSVKWAGDKTATPAHVEIPAYVAIDDVTYQVTQIEPSAFEGAVFLSSVAIPEGVTSIGESAFAGCTNLKSVSLPSTLKTIDYAAFKGCALEAIDIPDSVRVIGGEAFAECANLQDVSLPENVYAGQTAFNSITMAVSEMNQAESYVTSPDVQTYASDETLYGFIFGITDVPVGYDSLQERSISSGRHTATYWGGVKNSTSNEVTSYEQARDWLSQAVWASHAGAVQSPNTVSWRNYRPSFTIWFDPSSPDYIYTYILIEATSQAEVYRTEVTANIAEGELDDVRILSRSCYYPNDDNAILPGAATDQSVWNYLVLQNDWASTMLPQQKGAVAAPGIANPNGVPTGFKAGRSFIPAVLKHYTIGVDEKSVSLSVNTLRTGDYTVEADSHKLIEPTPHAGYRFQGWTGPGYSSVTPTANVDLRTAIAALGEGETELKFEGHWEKQSTARFDTGTGQHFDNVSYYKGDAPDLPVAQRTGFWFAGWYPTTGTEYWDGKQDGHTLYNGKMPADAYGDVTFNAVWTPKVYTVRYDTEQSKDKDGTRVVDPPANKSFAHPSAADAINAASGLTFGIDADGNAVSDLDVSANSYFDLADVARSMCEDYALGEPEKKLGAYPFKGWSKKVDLPIGTVPDDSAGGNRQWWTELRERADDGSFTSVNYFFAIFGDGWSDFSKDQCKTAYTVYGVWASTSETAIALAPTQPAYTNNVSQQVLDVDGRGSATRGTESIRFRENMGFIGQDGVEQLHTGTPERHEAAEIDSAMQLEAPVRYGFEFLGWGPVAGKTTDVADAASKLFVSYDEDAARDGSKTGFALTSAGAALIEKTGDDGYAYKGDSPTEWAAYWATRTVDVTFRIPSHAVDGVTLGSKDDGYVWYEGSAEETGQGANYGWYIAKKTWNYFDLVEYPAFEVQRDRYTYDGWYDEMKPSKVDSTDAVLESAGNTAKLVATFDSVRAKHLYVTGDGPAAAENPDGVSGLSIGEAYFMTGDPAAASAGAKTLWLWTSPIRINVASPMGVYLCTTNSYGQAVDPYVVGNDRRTQLEAQAEFKVSTSSHDLQLVDVTAEDIVDYSYNDDKTVNSASVVSQANPDGGGVCDKILNPKKTPERVSDLGNYTYDQDGSRMFWVSPVPTATADQTGVIYKSDGVTAETEAAKGTGASHLADAEKKLVPDVTTRRYFGFGTQLVENEGTESEKVTSDNRITDDLKGKVEEGADYLLDGFILRKGTASDGLAKTSAAGAPDTTYRFYYGLDMRRADFDLAGLQDVIDNGSHGLEYNAAFDQPLLRVKFTFAAARNPGISYYSARIGAGDASAPYDAAAELSAGDLGAVEVSAGAPSNL